MNISWRPRGALWGLGSEPWIFKKTTQVKKWGPVEPHVALWGLEPPSIFKKMTWFRLSENDLIQQLEVP